ncbi:hypothetical protein HDU81_010900 [Chytriomyces hyalinus]|nr:hypothetical protein HDU81_010900 [Chytriomyces hyalinus]
MTLVFEAARSARMLRGTLAAQILTQFFAIFCVTNEPSAVRAYKRNQPVKIETYQFVTATRQWVQTLYNVADVIGAVKNALPSKLGAVFVGYITLHAVVDGVEGPALAIDLPLSALSTGLTAKTALVIKSKSDMENIHMHLSGRAADPWGDEVAVFLGRFGASDSEGVLIGAQTTVSRDETVSNILEKLRRNNPLLIRSPPMSGKTSMATLISNHLKTTATDKCLIINLSMFDLSCRGENWVFESAFKGAVGVEWGDLHLLAKKRTIYLIVDDFQVAYLPSDQPGPLKNQSSLLWHLFIVYSSRFYGSIGAWDRLAEFSDAELKDFVVRNLDAAKESAAFTDESVNVFCANLKRLTGSHCGLCYATLDYLNCVLCASEGERSVDHVLRSLDNSAIFSHLQRTRAFWAINNTTPEELTLVTSVVFSEGVVLTPRVILADAKIITQTLARKGILVESGALNQDFVFSSPAMKRFFTEKNRIGPKLEEDPDTIDDLAYAIVTSIDYKHIQSSLEKAADVGGLFGTTGAIDFTVHSPDMEVFWGIELLLEGSRLEDHADPFDNGGRSEAVHRMFTDTCVLDIRQQPKGTATLDLKDLDTRGNLVIFTYDDSFSSGILYAKLWASGKAVSLSK